MFIAAYLVSLSEYMYDQELPQSHITDQTTAS